MHNKSVLVVFLLLVYGGFLWVVGLLLTQPKRFVELFVARRYRRWGVQVTVVDEGRLKRASRVFGFLTLAFLCLHATLVLHAIMTSK